MCVRVIKYFGYTFTTNLYWPDYESAGHGHGERVCVRLQYHEHQHTKHDRVRVSKGTREQDLPALFEENSFTSARTSNVRHFSLQFHFHYKFVVHKHHAERERAAGLIWTEATWDRRIQWIWWVKPPCGAHFCKPFDPHPIFSHLHGIDEGLCRAIRSPSQQATGKQATRCICLRIVELRYVRAVPVVAVQPVRPHDPSSN